MTTQSTTSPFTIIIHPDLANELDEHFSPGDGITAIEELYLELPKLHAPAKRNRTKRHTRLYRACYGWADLGFSYVQCGNQLHVLELWTYHSDELAQRPVDVVLGA